MDNRYNRSTNAGDGYKNEAEDWFLSVYMELNRSTSPETDSLNGNRIYTRAYSTAICFDKSEAHQYHNTVVGIKWADTTATTVIMASFLLKRV